MPSDGTPEILLQEAHELGRKQDAKLHRLLHLAAAAPIVVLTAGTIAVAEANDRGGTAAAIVLGSTIVLFVFYFAIEAVAAGWKEGPNIDRLLRVFADSPIDEHRLRVGLVRSFARDYGDNQEVLTGIRRLIAIQALIAVATFAALLLVLL